MVQSGPHGHAPLILQPVTVRGGILGWWRNVVVLLLAGWLQALSLAWPWPVIWSPGTAVGGLQLLSQVLLLLVVQGLSSRRQAFWAGWWWASAGLLGTFWWLYVSMHRYGGLLAPVAALAVWALAAALALFYALVIALHWRWRRAAALSQSLSWAACWTLAEWARGTWLTGFPWGASGYAHVDTLTGLAPWLGVYGLGAVAAALAAWVAAGWRTLTDKRERAFPLLMRCALLLAFCWPSGWAQWWAMLPTWTESNGQLTAVLLQGNIAQDEKFQPRSGVTQAVAWYGYTMSAALQQHPGVLVVAPETALPVLPQHMPSSWWQTLSDAATQGQSAFVLGLPMGDVQHGYSNSAWVGLPLGQAPLRYDKHHLVPFGEFIPPGFHWFVEMMHIPLGEFQAGPLVQRPVDWQGQRIAPNICYEDLFGEELAAAFNAPWGAPTVLVNLSNIAWFGDTIAVDQHRQIARMRALELQRPMLRATNTGATVAIDHRGRVSHALPPFTRATLLVEVDGRTGLTPYAWWAGRWGLWPLVGICLSLLALLWRQTGVLRP